MKLYLLLILSILFISIYGQDKVFASEPQLDSVTSFFDSEENMDDEFDGL